MKKKTVGIVLLVLGVLSLIGSIGNGSFAGYLDGVDASELVTILLTVGFIGGGILLILRDKPENKG